MTTTWFIEMYINYFNGFVVGTWFSITGINLYVTNMTHDINRGRRKQHDTEIPAGSGGWRVRVETGRKLSLTPTQHRWEEKGASVTGKHGESEKCAVAPVHKPSSQEDKPGEPRVQGQPGTLARLRPIWAVRQDPAKNQGGRKVEEILVLKYKTHTV